MKLTSNYAWKKTESALQSSRPTLAVTPGEPAGVGPEIAIKVALEHAATHRLVLVADCEMLAARARTALRSSDIGFIPFAADVEPDPHQVMVLHVPGAADARPGELNTLHAPYVLRTLDAALQGCLSGQFAALVTGPVHKGVINDAGIAFSGHTEYLTEHASGVPIMMLATPDLRVALATTHLPLRAVPEAITQARVLEVVRVVHADLLRRFGVSSPRIQVCGLNPHAGEGGHLGLEDDAEIVPAIAAARADGIDVDGPWPADTAFVPARRAAYDATIAMYHDQGLAVLKAVGFGEAVNVTLGLNVIRTSVDHGTALDIAGQGVADERSLRVAADLAAMLSATNA